MWNPSQKNSFPTQSSMPPHPPLDFTDTESTYYFSAFLPGSPGCSKDTEWPEWLLTPTNDERRDEQLSYTENALGGGEGDDLSANHLQDEQHDYTGNSMVVQQFGAGGGEELSGDHQLVESGDKDGITDTPLVVKKQTRRRSVVKKKTAFEKIKKERLELHYGKTRSEAAKSLEVSVPTFKRTCRRHGIPSWPSNKKKKKDLSTEISNVAEVQPYPAELRTVTAKVKYGNDLIKFEISSASKLVDLQEEISMRLKLEDGSFNIKYVDEDGDLVLIKLDADVRMCMKNLDTPKVKMEVLLCSN